MKWETTVEPTEWNERKKRSSGGEKKKKWMKSEKRVFSKREFTTQTIICEAQAKKLKLERERSSEAVQAKKSIR